MEDRKNGIVIRGIKAHRALVRSIECQIEKWIEREQDLQFLPRHREYKVEVDREDEQPFFHCSIKIRIGSREWRSYEGGKTIQESVSQALRHLRNPSTLSFLLRGEILKAKTV